MIVFVDASAFVALWKKDDANHKIASKKSEKLNSQNAVFVTSNIVIAEALTVIAMRINKKTALDFLERIEINNVGLIFINEELHSEALKIFKRISNKNVSFFDCTAFAAIEKFNIKKAFSFDKDFKRQRFELV